jgi:hypothetical protein
VICWCRSRRSPGRVYLLELVGETSRVELDRRIAEWTAAGWTQQAIADEVGCVRETIRDRQQRLGVRPRSNRDAPRRELAGPANLIEEEVILDAEVVPDDEVRQAREALAAAAQNPHEEEDRMAPPPSAPVSGEHWTARARRLGSALHDLAQTGGSDEAALEVARAEWRPVEAALKSAAEKAA